MRHKRRYIPITERRRGPKKKKDFRGFLIFMAICLLVVGISHTNFPDMQLKNAEPGTVESRGDSAVGSGKRETGSTELSFEDIPEYSGSPYAVINDNTPTFSEADIAVLSNPGYEYYSALDALGRCGYAEACVGQETMPEDERGDIWMVHPSGWRSGQGWERCHLIAFSLTGENANDHNLITGSRSFNVDGMLPFEIEVAEAGDKNLHVMYRVTPVYNGYELIPRGVHMMAQSVEDNSVSFNVFVYNVEPGKTIDYVGGYIK